MRIRVAVSMPEKGGRPAIAVAEVRRAPDIGGRRQWHYVIGHLERVRDRTIHGARDRVREIVDPIADVSPCVYIDVGTPQGIALRKVLRDTWPDRSSMHRPHAYERTKFDTTMFAWFLEAYSGERIIFRRGLPHRDELDRALILYRSGGVGKAGDELESEDEALVHAVSLALMFPTHGANALPITPEEHGSSDPVVLSNP
jgi:hypothetical protein